MERSLPGIDTVLLPNPADSRFTSFVRELLAFAYKNAVSCVFPVFIFLMLWVSPIVTPPFLHRYDFLLLVCLAFQAFMYYSGWESKDEVKVITIFHLIGLIMEIHKVEVGSWAYPEEAWTKVFDVPLYSGFMYASVASFMTQAWRHFDLQLTAWPRNIVVYILGAAIYVNFFTNAWLYDIRWFIIPAVFLALLPTRIYFTTNGRRRHMPLFLAFFNIGLFVWLAENIATYLGAWQYPYQHSGWQMVGLSKVSSWFLMVIVSFLIVAQLKHLKDAKDKNQH